MMAGPRQVKLIHVNGKLPNLALMKLAHWDRARGDRVTLSRSPEPELMEPRPDLVYASSIFTASLPMLNRVLRQWPSAVVGGTGSKSTRTVEAFLGRPAFEEYDYSIYPDYPFSLGFTQRGCRLRCSFCVVPAKEGRPKPVSTVAEIWRGYPHPPNIVLLDNDFFGQPREQWRARVREIRDGGFKVNFNQGINIRLVDDEAAECLAGLRYYDVQFKNHRLYTAWDNLRDERIFFRGVDRLEAAGVPARHIMVYMLVGYDPEETWERIFHRFDRMVERGVLPYPMVYNNARKDLKRFQRWVVTRLYKWLPWKEYKNRRGWKVERAGDADG